MNNPKEYSGAKRYTETADSCPNCAKRHKFQYQHTQIGSLTRSSEPSIPNCAATRPAHDPRESEITPAIGVNVAKSQVQQTRDYT